MSDFDAFQDFDARGDPPTIPCMVVFFSPSCPHCQAYKATLSSVYSELKSLYDAQGGAMYKCNLDEHIAHCDREKYPFEGVPMTCLYGKHSSSHPATVLEGNVDKDAVLQSVKGSFDKKGRPLKGGVIPGLCLPRHLTIEDLHAAMDPEFQEGATLSLDDPAIKYAFAVVEAVNRENMFLRQVIYNLMRIENRGVSIADALNESERMFQELQSGNE